VSAPKEGRIVESGTISAAKIALGLGLGGPDELKEPGPDDGRPMDSPAQARARAEGKPVPADPPDFQRTVVKGGRDVAAYLGVPVGVPLGEGEEGKPLPPETLTREQERDLQARRGELPQRVNWDRVEAKKLMARIDRALRQLGSGK
jgi:hypothetical protein